MRNRRTGAASLLGALAAVLAGCGGGFLGQGDHPSTVAGTFFGASRAVGQGVARSFVTLDADGKPTAIGARFTSGAMRGITVSPPPLSAAEFTLSLPRQAAAALPIADISFGYTTGHPPDPLEEPHIFIVFALETAAARAGITPDAPNAGAVPEAQYIPQDHRIGFIIIPGIGLPWFDPTEPVFTGEPFVTNIDQSFFQGRLAAIIPEAPVDFLNTRAEASAAIKQSAAVQKPGYYPTRFHVSYDAVAGEHVMTLEGLRLR